MKKLFLISLLIAIILVFTPAVYSSEIGLRAFTRDASYLNLDIMLALGNNSSSIIEGLSLPFSGIFKITPNLYFLLKGPLELVYLIGNNLAVGLDSTFGFIFSPTSGFKFWGSVGLIGEYIFLNKPSYQLGLDLRLRTENTSLSLLGKYDILSDLTLSGTAKVSYTYKTKNLGLYSNISLEYNDYLKALLAIDFSDLLKENITPFSFENTLKLELSGDIPIASKLSLSYLGSFSLNNLIASDKNIIFTFMVGPGLKYDINEKWHLNFSYQFRRIYQVINEYNSEGIVINIYDNLKYVHVITLGVRYIF